MIHDITANLHLECKENRKHVEETITIFGISIKTIDGIGNVISHVKRQIFAAIAIGVTVVATSLYSLFTTSQLHDIASSDTTDDIVDESNRVVTAISDMEKRLLHYEEIQKRS